MFKKVIKIQKINGLIKAGIFNYESSKIERYVDMKAPFKTYDFNINITSLRMLDANNLFLNFIFNLEILPDIAKIILKGNCIVDSPNSDIIIIIAQVLYKNGPEIFIEKNQHLIEIINKYILRSCFDKAREIGEENNIRFPNYEVFLEHFGIKNIKIKK